LYSANHAGYTEAAENVWGYAFPYYISQKDDYDDYTKYANSKNYDFTRDLTSLQIQNLLNTSLGTSNKFIKINLDTIATYQSGRISNLELLYTDANGVQNKKVLSKNAARTFFGFPSSMYTVTYNSSTDTYTFIGHGAGHGIGMSQIGALNRAQAGQTYKDILAFYYDKTYTYSCLASINSVTQNLTSAFTGETLNFQAQAVNGSGLGYLYKYTVEKSGQILYTGDYSSDSRLNYTANSIGDYTVSLYLKDSQSQSEYDDKRVLSFKVTGLGDVNLDGTVDIFDLVSISKNIDTTKAASANWNSNADINRDNILDINDLAAAARNYNVKY
jgi:stage II sporulation protein D